MAAKKSIAKGARTHNAAPKGRAADYPGRPLKPRSSAKSQSRHRKPAPRPRHGVPLTEQRAELLETLSNRLSLVETASLALQKFGDDPDVGEHTRAF
jgi:hypothetical protein